jgi:hypothetical protein
MPMPRTVAFAGRMLAIGCAGVLTACSNDGQNLEEERRAENELMRDIVRAGPAIEERLRKRVELNGSIVLINEKPGNFFLSLHVMPAHAPWSVNCGHLGLTLTFGSTGEFGSGVRLYLSGARLDEKTCKALAPLAASTVTAILDGK